MDAMGLLLTRRSIRKFLKRSIPQKDLIKIIETAKMAPNGYNSQPWYFLIIRNKAVIRKLGKDVENKIRKIALKTRKHRFTLLKSLKYMTFFSSTPVIIGVLKASYTTPLDECLKEKEQRLYYERERIINPALQSVSAAITYITLAAHALGYGSCWMTSPLVSRKELEKRLRVKKPYELIALVAIGRPSSVTKPPKRKSFETIAKFL